MNKCANCNKTMPEKMFYEFEKKDDEIPRDQSWSIAKGWLEFYFQLNGPEECGDFIYFCPSCVKKLKDYLK